MRRRSDVSSELQKALNSARKDRGWSQRTLAEKAGVSVDTVQKIEAGRVSPSVSMLERIAAPLRIPVTSLLGCGHHDVPPGWSTLGRSERMLITALIEFVAAGREGRSDSKTVATAGRGAPGLAAQVEKALARDASRE